MAVNIKEIIAYYLEHDVSERNRDRVLERIADTMDDKDVNESLGSLWAQSDSASMDEGEISAAYERLRITNGEKKKSKYLKLFTWQRIAAVIIPLVMLVVFGRLYVQMSDELKVSQVVAMLQEHTVSDECKTIALADGTHVRLNQSSVLLYPEKFSGKERKVFLTGEAFFDIKHDGRHPFHVSTPYFDITDLGTSFSVSSYATDVEVSTTLKTGKIELKIVGEDKVYSMKPNDQLVYNVKTKAVDLRQVTDEDDGLNWRNKQISLDDVTLAEAARIMGDVYGVKFVFRSSRHRNTKITVHFNRGESLKKALAIVGNLVPGLEYELKKDKVIIK
mgnify:FL=1